MGQGQMEQAKALMPMPMGLGQVYTNPCITERLLAEKAALEQRLTKVTVALDALETNPEVAKVIEAINEVAPF